MPPAIRPRPGLKPPAQPPKKSTGANNNKLGFLIVISGLALVAAGYFVGYPLIQRFKKPQPVVIWQNPSVDTTKVIIPEVEEIVVQQELSTSIPKGYYIIVGSFRNKNNADNIVHQIKKDIELNVLYFKEEELYRVSAGYYDNIHKAYNDIYSIKDLDGCADAWVLENQ